MSGGQERTEKATPKRLKEAREKGELGTSRDLTAWLSVGAGAFALPFLLQSGADATTAMVIDLGTFVGDPDPQRAVAFLTDGLGALGAMLLPFFGAVLLGALGGAVLQGGIHLKKFEVSGRNFDLVAGSKRIFGAQAMWEGAKALLKSIVVGLVLFAVAQGLMPVLMTAGGLSVASLLEAAAGGIGSLLQAAIAAGLALAAVDLLVVMRRNRKRSMMTKREVRDEAKNSEGDPLVRSHRRSRQLSMSRNRMIAAVADADVVLLNPTHIAVALKYEPGRSAPRVVAKGAGLIATRIREKAGEHRVPMVEDVPLARALHAACEVGQEIPVELYTAVARVLAFVHRLTARGSAAGVHRLSPQPV